MRILLAGVVVLASLTACGTEAGEPTVTGKWTEHRLADGPAGDSQVGFAADGDDVIVVMRGDGGTVHSYLSTDGGSFESGAPLEADEVAFSGAMDPVRLDGTWWVVSTGARVIEDGLDESFVYEPRVFRSDDGLTWESVDVSGIPPQVDINAVAVADGVLVALGVKRNDVDTGGGATFEAAVWRSKDGLTWGEAALPGVVSRPSYDDESTASHLTLVDGRLLAGGRVGRTAVLWSSTDAGDTWTRVESPEVSGLYEVYGLASQGSTVLVSGPVKGEETGRFLRSDDGGSTFAPTADQPAADSEMGYARLWSGAGRFLTFTEPSYDTYSDPAVCYADIDVCGSSTTSDIGYVHASEGGSAWFVMDTSGLGVGDEFAGVVGTDDGRIVMMHVDGGGLLLHSWAAGAPLPEGNPPAEPERLELVTVAEGDDPEPGVRYHAPLYVHCGMDWLFLGDTPWQRTDGGPDLETGAGDEAAAGWPLVGQTIFGYATLVDGGAIEYSIGEGDDTEVIATYEQTGEQAPGCD
jgi:hypothetical protein